MEPFIYKTRIYYEDTDCGGVVYNANYMKFMERARTEFQLSFSDELNQFISQNFFFAVRSIQMDILHPARLYDQIRVETKIIKIGRASLDFEQIIKNENEQSVVFCKGLVKVACLNTQFKPTAIPERLKEEIEGGN